MSPATAAFGKRNRQVAPKPRRDLGVSGLFIIASFAGVAMLYGWLRFADEFRTAMPGWILSRGDVWSSDPAAIERGWSPAWLFLSLAGLLAGLIGWWAARSRTARLEFLPACLQAFLAYLGVFVALNLPKALSTALFGRRTIEPLEVLQETLNGLVGGIGHGLIELLFGGYIVIGVGLALWMGLTVPVANGLDRLFPRGDR